MRIKEQNNKVSYYKAAVVCVMTVAVFGILLSACRESENGSLNTGKENGRNKEATLDHGVTKIIPIEEHGDIEENRIGDGNGGKYQEKEIEKDKEIEKNKDNSSGKDKDRDIDNDNGNDIDKDEVEDKDKVTLVMVGDILLHDAVNKCFEYEKGKYDYNPIFEHTEDEIRAADIAIVNQEVIIGGQELGVSGYPSFNAPCEIGDALTDTGFDIVCHATNHVLDRGKKGLINCMDYWENKHPDIEILGIHDTEEDSKEIYVLEINDIKIAFLNYTYGTNGISLPGDMNWSVDLLSNKEKIANDLKKAEEMADLTVVCPHWGTEYRLTASDEQKRWVRLFLENGADLVIGTHPHVIEPVEWVEDEETGNRMLVYYSLGNYVNWTSGEGPGTSNRMIGGMAKVDIGYDEQGKPAIVDYGVEALVCHVIKEKGKISVYRLKDYSEELAGENAIRFQDSDFSRNYCVDLCNEVWGGLWD